MEPALPEKIIKTAEKLALGHVGSDSLLHQSNPVKKITFASAPEIHTNYHESSIVEQIAEGELHAVEEDRNESDNEINDLTDNVLFPGISFDMDPKGKKRGSKMIRNGQYKGVNLMERSVLEKYTKHGCLTVFKEKKEIQDFKKTNGFKNHAKDLRCRLEELEHSLSKTIDDLESSKEQLIHAESEIEKIKNELGILIEPFSDDRRHSNLQTKDTKLIMSARYRVLLEQQSLHQNIKLENQSRIAILQDTINCQRDEIEKLVSEQSNIEPQLRILQEEEEEKLQELAIVAKYRYLENQRKLKIVARVKEMNQTKLKEDQFQSTQESKFQEPVIKERNDRMKAFFEESLKRVP
jgi:hypothetical protein